MTAHTPAANISTFAVYDTLKPTEGPRIAKAIVPIDTDGQGRVNLNGPAIMLASCQGVFVDNDTAALITLTHTHTGYRVIVLPYTAGWYQMEATDDLAFRVTSSVVSVPVTMYFSNTPTATIAWGTRANATPALDGTNRTRVVVENMVSVLASPAIAGGGGYGAQPFTRNTAASGNAQIVNAGARSLIGVSVWNSSGVAQWLKLFDKAAAPALGTDSPVYNIMVPAGASLNFETGPVGVQFVNGLAVAMTAGAPLPAAPAPGPADTSGFTIAWRP